jgi:Flp pilus assembly protein TadB
MEMIALPFFFLLFTAAAVLAGTLPLSDPAFRGPSLRLPSGRGREAGALVFLPALALLAVAAACLFPRVVPALTVVGLAAFFLGRWAARRRRQARLSEGVRRELPTLLDALVLNIETGQALIPSFLEAQAVLDPAGPLFSEISRLESDLRLGLPQMEALARMRDRLPVPELEGFLGGIIQALELGTPVAKVLREQSSRMREHLILEGERFANTLSLRLLGPLFLFIFPAAFLLILAPVIIALLENRSW